MVRTDGDHDGEYEHGDEFEFLRVVRSAFFSGSWVVHLYDRSVCKFERYRENGKQRDDEWRKRDEYASRCGLSWCRGGSRSNFRDVRVWWREHSNAVFIRDGVEWKFERGGVLRSTGDEAFIVVIVK